MLTSSGVSNCLVKPADMMVARAAFPTLASYGKSATAKAETLLFRRLDSSRSEGYRHLPLLLAAKSLPLVIRRLAIEISVCSRRGPRLTTQKPQFGVSASGQGRTQRARSRLWQCCKFWLPARRHATFLAVHTRSSDELGVLVCGIVCRRVSTVLV